MSKLCNKRLLAASLLEWTLDSETTFIEAKDNKELIEIAKKFEIVIPSPDLALFKTIYAEIDKVNRNGIILPKKAVEEGLPTIRAKQINWSHEGAHQICGHILDAKIENNKIIVYGVLFKSLFREEFDTVEKLFAEKKLFVSYEIWNRDEKGNSVVKNLNNGYKEINPILFHGCGMLLLDDQTGEPIPPACPNAMVLQLASKKVIEETEKIVEKIFEHNDNLVYANLVKEEPICTKCKTCTCQEEGGKDNIMAEEIKIEEIIPEVKVEEPIKAEEIKIEETQAAEVKPEEVVKTTPEETKVEAEVKPEIVAQVAETIKEVEKEKPIKTVSYYTCENIESIGEDGGIDYQSHSYEKIIRTYKDGHEEIEIREGNSVNDSKISKYTSAQLEEKVNAVKAEVEVKLAEKEIEITNLKKELDSKNQEIAELKTPKVEVAKVEVQPELVVGNAETKTIDKYKERRKKINKAAYGHDNNGN